jgi:predicted nucleotidyltransferase
MESVAKVLFGKTRQAVLGLLFERPGDSYYLRRLCQLTGISPGAMQTELRQLTACGLVERERDGNRVTYRANVTHPVHESLRDVVRKTCGIPSMLTTALLPLAREITFAALYGSMAKGSSHARSDVDVLLVGRVSLERALAALSPLESQLGREISVRVFTREELKRRLKKGEAFVRSIMNGPLTPLLGSADDAR